MAAVPSPGTIENHMSYGVSPSTDLPGFLPGIAPTFVDRPLMLPFADITSIVTGIMLVDPSAELALERVIAARASTSRTLTSGATLTSSLQGITNTFSASSLQFTAPLVTSARLGTTSLFDIESIPVPASSAMQELSFVTEAGFNVDDYIVTLYEVTGASLAVVRVYHVIASSVKVDGSLLASGHEYVFAITTRSGMPPKMLA